MLLGCKPQPNSQAGVGSSGGQGLVLGSYEFVNLYLMSNTVSGMEMSHLI